jgi:hypothetical protein
MEKETRRETGHTLSGKASTEVGIIFTKGKGEVAGEIESTKGSSSKGSQTLSSRVTAISGLRQSRIPVVIDDYHYIPKDIQGGIVRALKPLIFDGLAVVAIAIPHRRYDAVKVEKEMTGRISPITIPTWKLDELIFISETGFGLLNYKLSDTIQNKMSAEAIGSPHLMQEFCRGLCKQYNLERSESRSNLVVRDVKLETVFREVAETIGRPIFEKLARGPRQRTDRIQRELKDGRTVDIYELILHGLAHIRPELVSIEYEELRAAIREVSASQIPQLHEVARVLKHMATIAATDQSSTPVIDFEEEEKRLHITDPFFAFYLRWGQLAEE